MPDPDDPPREPLAELRRPLPPRSWRERVEHLADATGTTPARLAVGAAALVAALLAAVVVLRPEAPPPEVALPFASSSAGLASTTTAPTSTTTSVPIVVVVHVAGSVLAPGVYRLAPEARVIDAVDAAGGLAPAADGARLNLAAPVADGDRVYVPAVGEDPPDAVSPTGAAAVGSGPGVTQPAGPIDLNRADVAALDALPGVGPATAAAIVEHRERIGGFTSVDQLLDVRGIGEAKLEQLRPLVRV